MDNHFSLEGKTFLVTGSTTGLGRAMANALGAAGARVAMNYQNNTERAESAFNDFKGNGYEGGLFRASVINPEDIHRLRQALAAEMVIRVGCSVNGR